MYLLLDNSNNDKIIWTTGDNEIFEFSSASGVLAGLDQLLKKKKTSLADIEGLAVVVSKGRFTGARIAVTVVNTLAFALGISTLAVKDDSKDWVNKLRVRPVGQYVSAQYSAPANIGKTKNQSNL